MKVPRKKEKNYAEIMFKEKRSKGVSAQGAFFRNKCP
jgi:hypothetical protein